MAGLKKKKKDKGAGPNLVLVIFLVFFVLVSIGLGIWVYTDRVVIDDATKKYVAADKAQRSEKTRGTYYEMLYRDLRNAFGEKLEGDDFANDFLEFSKDDYGAFKNEKNKEAARKLMVELREKLGGKGGDPNYASDFPTLLKESRKNEDKLKRELAAEIAKRGYFEKISEKYTESQDKFHKDASARITEGNAKAMAAAKEKFEAFQILSENNRQLALDLKEKQEEFDKYKGESGDSIKALTRRINVLEKDRQDLAGAPGGGAPAGPAARGDNFFPLMLDVSPGKPLWDTPVGKITYVNMEARQVTINLGSAHGVKPELTFNIFGANAAGRAEKQLKGTIEVIKVLDANTSTARITSLYDSEGTEILMNLQTRGRLLRESEAPIRAGDLLFNLFWGTRVAIAGYVSITGEPSDNPTEQMRQMDDLIYMLKRSGMQVDAYVDLRDGKIKGNITSKTRYLILGDVLPGAAPTAKAPAAKAPAGDDEEKKEPAKEADPAADRSAQVRASSAALSKEARERGLLMISQENFSVVIGYRRTRSANLAEISSFRPTLPNAGSGDAGVIAVPPRGEKGPEMEKQAPEMEK